MQKIVICRGLPASGKSTWAREFCKKNPDYIRVCRDDLRNMRGTYWIPKQEDLITDMEDACVRASLDKGKHVIVDATNFGDRTKDRMQAIADEFDLDIRIEIQDFTDVPLEECIKRDLKRENSLGREIIMKFYDKHLKPEPPTIAHDPTLPDCILVDIDGTLAHKTDRGIYEWEKVGTDRKDDTIHDVISRFGEENIILMSGRNDVCRQQTIEWLQENKIFIMTCLCGKTEMTAKIQL